MSTKQSVFEMLKTLCSGYDEVVKELEEREKIGIDTYGVSLTTFNGRDALKDCKEELLDAMAYLTQWWLEIPRATSTDAVFTTILPDLCKMYYLLQGEIENGTGD